MMSPPPITKVTKKCSHQGEKGRCDAYAMHGQEFCYWHSPDYLVMAKRLDASMRGGKGNAVSGFKGWEAIEIRGADDLKSIVAATINAVLSGKVHPTVGNSIAGLVSQYGKLIELSDFDQRLKNVEEVIKNGKC